MQDWKTYKLEDVATLQRGFDLPNTERIDGKYPVFAASGFSTWHNTFKVKGPGVTTGRSGTLGQVHFINQDFWPLNTSLWVKNFHGNDERYIYYFLQTLNFGDYNSGTSVPTLNRNDVHKLEVCIPEYKEQTAIASILSALDDKIELNLQMNKTLEEMAMVLYKHWFVDFGPFQNGKFIDSELGMIPEGWEVKSIYSEANFINGAAFKAKDFVENKNEGLPVIKIVEIKQGITAQTMYSNKELDSKYIIYNNEILFPWSGNPNTSLGIHLWDKGKALLNQHTFVVRVENTNNKCFVFNTLKHLLPTFVRLASHKQTTGLGHVTVANLKDLMIPSPNSKSIMDYNIEALPFFDMIYSNQIENQILTSLRDTLLPKLISGEVRVKDIQQLVEASL